MKKKEKDRIEFEESSGNVFADLGFPDAEERLQKADLSYEIYKAITSRGLTQREAAKILGVDQPKVSAIIRGNLKGFSLERLIALLKKLDIDVHIAKKPEMQVSTYMVSPTIPLNESQNAFQMLFQGLFQTHPVSSFEYTTHGLGVANMGTLGNEYSKASPVYLNIRNEKEREMNDPAPIAA